MQTIVILGSQGNLGSQLQNIIPDAIGWDRDDVDITNIEELAKKLEKLENVTTVINCVAFNDLDKAEEFPDLAYQLNAEAVEGMARLCKKLGIEFIHFSTGYVFSGNDKPQHVESDTPDPNSVYAKSKRDGETKIIEIGGNYKIIRTNLLFGPAGKSENAKPSVVDTMLKVGLERKVLKGITDEQSNFTYTPDLARATKSLIDNKVNSGIYHLTNEGYGSWYDLCKEIFLIKGWRVADSESGIILEQNSIIIEPVISAQFLRKANRPKSAVILNTKLPKLRNWKEALAEYLNSK